MPRPLGSASLLALGLSLLGASWACEARAQNNGNAPPSHELNAPASESPVDSERPPIRAPRTEPSQTEPNGTRERDWRYPRERSRRPLTLPQGVMELENAKTVTYLNRTWVNVHIRAAGGLHDDFEVGATLIGLGLNSILPRPHDPEIHARLRMLSGPVQLALRSNLVFPLQSANTQWGLTFELAWTLDRAVRLDTGLDYQMLFDQPFQQRVGIPLAWTFQAGINAFTVTTGLYVFNDFDDVDVPLLARYSVAFAGHQGPIAQVGLEGGLLDVIPNPEVAWTVRGTVTWFIYFGRP